jgi:hypothetical protein
MSDIEIRMRELRLSAKLEGGGSPLDGEQYYRRFHNCFHTWTNSWMERALGARSLTMRQREYAV